MAAGKGGQWVVREAGCGFQSCLRSCRRIRPNARPPTNTALADRPACPPQRQALGGPAAHAAGEKALTRSVATANPKNYQLWNYRRRLALALGAGPAQVEEVRFVPLLLLLRGKGVGGPTARVSLGVLGGGI